MQYAVVKQAVFLSRPNRFIAKVLLDGREETVHVKNTGRCREILKPGVPVLLEAASNPSRKTQYSLIAVYKGERLINIDSQVPNTAVYEAIQGNRLPPFTNCSVLKREVTFGSSRFDLYYDRDGVKGFIEVKGVTLEESDVAMFPDAPTERGAKHVYELVKAVEAGYEGNILFLIQMKGTRRFVPNVAMDPAFAAALQTACKSGVRILAWDSVITENGIELGDEVEIQV